MELRLLRYFLAVAREGSITRAAEVLHITQPTLSRQLAQLERELDTVLFSRAGRRLELTDQGLLLRRRAEEILELADKTERELSQAAGTELEGTVSIGWGDIASVDALARVMDGFARRHPRVTFDCYTATADHIALRMERGLTDVGLMLEPIDTVKYDFVRLKRRERFVAAMSPDDPLAAHTSVSPSDLLDRPLIMPRHAMGMSELVRWFGGRVPEGCVRFESNLTSSSAVMAAQGLGRALVVDGSLRHWSEDDLVFRPLEPTLEIAVALAWRRGKPFGAAARAFIEFACERLG